MKDRPRSLAACAPGIRILLVRHGETDFNRSHRFQGRMDIPLNARGKRQVRALAEALRDEPLRAIHSSPLIRALETARSVRTFHSSVPLYEEEGLSEMDLGEIDGMEAGDWMSRHPEFARTWRSTPSLVRMPGGESLGEVQSRAVQTLQRILGAYPAGSTLLLCSHNFVNRALLCHAQGVSLDRFREFPQDAAALNILCESQGRLAVQAVNDVSHLKRLEADP